MTKPRQKWLKLNKVKTENQELYGFVEELMHTAFPAQERRDTPNSVSIRTVIPFLQQCDSGRRKNPSVWSAIGTWRFLLYRAFCHRPSCATGLRQTCIRKYQTKLQSPIVLEVKNRQKRWAYGVSTSTSDWISHCTKSHICSLLTAPATQACPCCWWLMEI